MCDTLCVLRPAGALFAKNSDRPSSEVQLIESHPARDAGGALRTTHMEIPDEGSYALLGSRPEWMWGFEHGVNEHRVAIGNEKVWTTLNPVDFPPALTGMDLVRLGLERARIADEALDVMTGLLAEFGQGGVCDQTTGEAYFSSFIIADPNTAWVLETSGRSWVAAPVRGGAAISNRLTLRTDWTRSSPDITPGTDWDTFRHPNAPTGHADVRLAASRACISAAPPEQQTPATMAAHLRDHGTGPWAAPEAYSAPPSPVPGEFRPDGTGVSVCMHIRGFQNTTSSIIAELPADAAAPLRAWVAAGNPCVSVFVPVFPPGVVAGALAQPGTWMAFAALRDRVEADEAALPAIRAALAPLESDLWREAEGIAPDPSQHAAFVERTSVRLREAVATVQSPAKPG